MTTRVVRIGGPRSIQALERLPEWWRGKANARLMFAREAMRGGPDKGADHHLRVASAYERKIKAGGPDAQG